MQRNESCWLSVVSPRYAAERNGSPHLRLTSAGIAIASGLETDVGNMLKILLIEDNLADQRLALEAFKYTENPCQVQISADGKQALNLLTERMTGNETLPDLILLDLNLPRVDGREVLRVIKSDPRLKRIPVLILSSSTSPTDIAECYNLHANCYLIKPMDVDTFFELIRKVEELWFPNAQVDTASRIEASEPCVVRSSAMIPFRMQSSA